MPLLRSCSLLKLFGPCRLSTRFSHLNRTPRGGRCCVRPAAFQISHSPEHIINGTMEIVREPHETFHGRLRLPVMPTIDRLFRKPRLLFEPIFRRLKVVQQKGEPLRKRRSLLIRFLRQQVGQSQQLIGRTVKMVGKFYERIDVWKPVSAQQRQDRRSIDARRFGKGRRIDLRLLHQVFQILR